MQGISIETVGRATGQAGAQGAVVAFEDHRVHAEGERALHPRIGAVGGQRIAHGVAGGGGERIHIGDAAARAGLHQAQPHRAFGGVEAHLVEVVFVVCVQAVQYQVGPKALHRHRRVACGGDAAVQLGEAGLRDDEQRVFVRKRGRGFDFAGPLRAGQAALRRVEAHQPQRLADGAAAPLRGGVAQVERSHLVVPHRYPHRGALDSQWHLQRRQIWRAQGQTGGAQRGLDQRHPRHLPLRDETALRVDQHPGTVEFEAGLDQPCRVGREATAALDRVHMQRGQAHRHIE